MKILAALHRALQSHPIAVGAFGVVALLLISIAISVPIVRHTETDRLERATARSSQLLVVALANPSIFSGEPDTAVADLNESVIEIGRVHDEVVLYPVYFAKSAARAALAYTEYAARIGNKLTQVAQAQLHARTSSETYEHDVEILKASNLAGRPAAQEDVNAISGDARNSTELAYQECALLATLTSEFGIVKTRALGGLANVGQDVQPAIAAIDPKLHAALLAAHARRKVFNPAARTPY